MKRIQDKIKDIKEYLCEFQDIIPNSYKNYKNNIEKKAACERYIEKIVEAITDLAFLIIKSKKLRLPEDDSDAFSVLLENNIINNSLSEKLKEAKGMRNIIAHQYGKIDNEIIYESIKNELIKDVKLFIKIIEKTN